MSQKEFAEKIGVTQAFLAHMENERLNIEKSYLEKKILIAIGEQTESENKAENPMKEKTIDDNVHSPKHYMLESLGIEVKDIIFEVTKDMKGKEAVCVGNILKYVMRARKKNGMEDYEKAYEYLGYLLNE